MQAWVKLVKIFHAFFYIVLDGSESGYYGRGSKSMGYAREMGKMSLDHWVQNCLWSSIAQWGSILVEKFHKFIANIPVK